MPSKILTHRDLEVWKGAFELGMDLFEISKGFPAEERYSLTDQLRRSSRSVAANLAEAWRKRRYRAAFIAKLSDVETEAAETQVWIEFAMSCGYIDQKAGARLNDRYDKIIATVVRMIARPQPWILSD